MMGYSGMCMLFFEDRQDTSQHIEHPCAETAGEMVAFGRPLIHSLSAIGEGDSFRFFEMTFYTAVVFSLENQTAGIIGEDGRVVVIGTDELSPSEPGADGAAEFKLPS